MPLRRGGAPPPGASNPAPGENEPDDEERRNAREGLGGPGSRAGSGDPNVPDSDGDGVTDPGYESPDSDSDDDSDSSTGGSAGGDYPNPIAGDPPARGSAADDNNTGPDDAPDGRDLGSSVSDGDRRRAQEQRRAEERVDRLDPTDPDSPGGTTVGSRETERYLRAAAEAGVTLEDVEENGALAAQIERQTDVDPRELASERGGERSDVSFDPAEGEFTVTTRRRRRPRRGEDSQPNGLTLGEARNAAEGIGAFGGRTATGGRQRTSLEGGDVRLLITSRPERQPPEGGDVRLQSESRRSVPVNTATPVSLLRQTERQRVNQDRVSQLVSDAESVTGLDVPGNGPVTTTRDPDREQFGDFDTAFPEFVPVVGGQETDTVASNISDGLVDAARGVTDPGRTNVALPGVTVGTAGGSLRRPTEEETTGERALQDTAGGVASLGGLLIETPQEAAEFTVEAASETAAGRGDEFAGRVGQRVVNSAVELGEATATDPQSVAFSALGASLATGGAIGAATRLGGARAGRAASVAIQPGEEAAIAAARLGAISPKLASRVPGVSRSQIETEAETRVDGGRGDGPASDGGRVSGLEQTAGDTVRFGGDDDGLSVDMDALAEDLQRVERREKFGDARPPAERGRERAREAQEDLEPPEPRTVSRPEFDTVSSTEFRTVSRGFDTSRSGPTAAQRDAFRGARFDPDPELPPGQTQLAAALGRRTPEVDLRESPLAAETRASTTGSRERSLLEDALGRRRRAEESSFLGAETLERAADVGATATTAATGAGLLGGALSRRAEAETTLDVASDLGRRSEVGSDIGVSTDIASGTDTTLRPDATGRTRLGTDLDGRTGTQGRTDTRSRTEPTTEVFTTREIGTEFGSEFLSESNSRTETSTEPQTEPRREFGAEVRPDSRRERRTPFDLRADRGGGELENAFTGDEGRFVYKTRSIL